MFMQTELTTYSEPTEPPPAPPVPPSLLTADDLAARLQVSYWTVIRYVKKGMPHVKIGKLYRFTWEKVQTWLTAGGADASRRTRTRAKRAPKS